MGLQVFFFAFAIQAISVRGSNCGADWVYNPHHRSCLKPQAFNYTWLRARYECTLLSSALVHVDSSEMIDFIVNNMKGSPPLLTSDDIWISSNDLLKADDWRGVFGAKMTFTSWSAGQPDLSAGQNCVLQALGDERNQSTQQCDDRDVQAPSFHQSVCESWPDDISAAKFKQMTGASDVSSTLGKCVRLVPPEPGNNPYDCSVFCLKHRYMCDGFVFNPAQRICTFLRLFQPGSREPFMASSEISAVENDGAKVFMMDG